MSTIGSALRQLLPAELIADSPQTVAALTGSMPNPDSAARHPVAVVTPRDSADVAEVLAWAGSHGASVSVRGGGHSTFCTADEAVLLDLRRLADAEVTPTGVSVGGGITMGGLVAALAPSGGAVPVGREPTPGMGLALHGGFGGLSRAHGLTLDHLRSVEIVLPDGTVKELSSQSTGPEADLWWAVRGAGAAMGVVTRADFDVVSVPEISDIRRLVTPQALAAVWQWAVASPPEATASLILGRTGDGQLVLLVDVMCVGQAVEDAPRLATDLDDHLAEADGTVLAGELVRCAYVDQPIFDLPPLTARPTVPVSTYQVCPLLGAEPDYETLADRLVGVLRDAPTPFCRVEMQQSGGAVIGVSSTATAFWNRDVSWNVPVRGAWTTADHAASARDWVARAWGALEPEISGYYIVDSHPDADTLADEVSLAYGENLPRLRALRSRVDRGRVLRHAYPF